MTKTFSALAASAVIALAITAAPTGAKAHCLGCYSAGGFVAGALIGGAIVGSSPYRYHGPEPYYGYSSYYERPCRLVNRRYWDGFMWRMRAVEVCY